MANKITVDINEFYSQEAVDLMNKMIKETKENNMKKQEINQRIHNLEEELAELKHLLDQPEGRWRAEKGGVFYYINFRGHIVSTMDHYTDSDDELHDTSNYFQTKEHAKESNIYKILNDPYEYYFVGVSDNWDDVPKDGSAEFYSDPLLEWFVCREDCVYHESSNYRWKK